MPKTFAELMEQFRNPGETGIPETFADELAETFDHEISTRDAAIAERDNKYTELENAKKLSDAEVTRVKAVNYDLMVAAPKAGDEPADNEPAANAEKQGVESLFE